MTGTASKNNSKGSSGVQNESGPLEWRGGTNIAVDIDYRPIVDPGTQGSLPLNSLSLLLTARENFTI